VESVPAPGCPVCGVLAARVHFRRRQRVRDLPVAGPVELIWLYELERATRSGRALTWAPVTSVIMTVVYAAWSPE
jgi:transposase